MSQLHKRFTDEQVEVLFRGYCQGMLARAEVEEMLGISTRAGQCLYQCLQDPVLRPAQAVPEGQRAFGVCYRRPTEMPQGHFGGRGR